MKFSITSIIFTLIMIIGTALMAGIWLPSWQKSLFKEYHNKIMPPDAAEGVKGEGKGTKEHALLFASLAYVTRSLRVGQNYIIHPVYKSN